MSIGIRGFTIGYDFYAPERSVCFHHYAEGKNAKARNKGMFTSSVWISPIHSMILIYYIITISAAVPHYWENSNQFAG